MGALSALAGLNPAAPVFVPSWELGLAPGVWQPAPLDVVDVVPQQPSTSPPSLAVSAGACGPSVIFPGLWECMEDTTADNCEDGPNDDDGMFSSRSVHFEETEQHVGAAGGAPPDGLRATSRASAWWQARQVIERKWLRHAPVRA